MNEKTIYLTIAIIGMIMSIPPWGVIIQHKPVGAIIQTIGLLIEGFGFYKFL